MAKNLISSEKEWQIEADAWTLIEAEKVKADKKRLINAEKKAKEISKKLADEAKKNMQIANKFNKKGKK